MRLIALIIVLGIAEKCFGDCRYSRSELTLSPENGILKPKNYPRYIRGGQTCKWEFSTEKHIGEPLFIFIVEMESFNAAAVQLGEEPEFHSMPLVNCRIYGVRITELDSHLLDNLIQKYESEGKNCTGWSVSEKKLETVTFWSYKDKTHSFYDAKFEIIYDYKILKNSVRQTTSTTQTTPIQQSTTSNVGLDKPGTHTITGESQNIGYVVAIVLLVITLIVVFAALVFVIYKLKKANKTRYSFTTTISPTAQRQQETASNIPVENYAVQTRPGNQANPMYQAASQTSNVAQSGGQYSDPYAFIPDENSLHASSSNGTPNVTMYDVPTNNRERAPTATSGYGNIGEPQVPRNEDTTRDQTGNPASRDVYAVVQKGNNQQR